MKKRRYLVYAIAGLFLFVTAISFMSKPNENDFVQWFERDYGVNCVGLDDSCTSVKIDDKTFTHTDGYYDTSVGFLSMGMQTKRLLQKY
ncbi:hypothetical protein FZW96_14465 [Bacillus sp. BGMRC 2118]|nr:hypothetical protein FZW96_14465 [Bacillus sp. BGMRC 2118]